MKNKDYSSFRDPAGYIYYEGDLVYRKGYLSIPENKIYVMNEILVNILQIIE